MHDFEAFLNVVAGVLGFVCLTGGASVFAEAYMQRTVNKLTHIRLIVGLVLMLLSILLFGRAFAVI